MEEKKKKRKYVSSFMNSYTICKEKKFFDWKTRLLISFFNCRYLMIAVCKDPNNPDFAEYVEAMLQRYHQILMCSTCNVSIPKSAGVKMCQGCLTTDESTFCSALTLRNNMVWWSFRLLASIVRVKGTLLFNSPHVHRSIPSGQENYFFTLRSEVRNG